MVQPSNVGLVTLTEIEKAAKRRPRLSRRSNAKKLALLRKGTGRDRSYTVAVPSNYDSPATAMLTVEIVELLAARNEK